MRSWLLVAVLSCGGCDRLFGITEIPSGSQSDLGRVQGQYLQVWVENDADGNAQELEQPFPASQLSGVATLDDGSTRPVTIDDASFTFTTPHPNDHYSLQLVSPSHTRTFDLSAAALVLVDRTTKRPSNPPAPPGTGLGLNLQTRQSGNMAKEELITTGTWSRTQVTSATSFAIDCSMSDSSGAPIDMLSPHDAAYYTSTQPTGTGYVRLMYAAEVPDVATVAGTIVTLPSSPLTPKPVDASSCTIVTTHGNDEAQRQLTAVGGGASIVGWFVAANPGLQLALITELPLANGVGESQVPVMYGNPFGLAHVDVLSASSATNAQGATSAVTSIVPVNGCSGATTIPAGQIALVSSVSLGGTALATSSQFVTLPAGEAIDIAFDVSADGDADYFAVELDQIVGASFTTIDEIVTRDHVVHVPASHLITTSTYAIRVSAAIGYPDAGEGDFLAMTEAAALSVYTTPTFRPQ